MKTNLEKSIGYSLILGAIGVFVPYTILTLTFDYPDVLRQDSGVILTRFHQGGAPLILTWLAFALLGLPLLVAYSLIGRKLGTQSPHIRWITSLGVISIVVQIVGLLRWVFVVPVLAHAYVKATHETTREAVTITFGAIHQFGGVLLGEHLGQLFTVLWTVLISVALFKERIVPQWLAGLGYVSSFIYFLAQSELLATVIPSFPVVNMAGFVGSTLWLVWLVLVGIRFVRVGRLSQKGLSEKP